MASVAVVTNAQPDVVRDRGLQDYRKKLLEHREIESRLKEGKLFRHFALLRSIVVLHCAF